jgi:fructose-1,6-bisphosphatase/inositol monophosphatase family enzyme
MPLFRHLCYNTAMKPTEDPAAPLSPQTITGSLQVIQEIFRQFRTHILERAGKSAFTGKRDGSPVTETDMDIEVTLQGVLAQRFPGLPIFGEETGYGDTLPAACWLIDPLDGTKAFVAGTPTFTCMAVLIQQDEAIACVIYDPSADDMYVAQKGKGAFKNDQRLDLATMPLPHVALCKMQFIDELNGMLQSKGVVCEAAPSGGGFGFARVAEGLIAARFQLWSGGYVHDYAPGGLLVREAGGVILPILEDTYTYETRCFVACHPELAAVIRPHLPRLRELELMRKKEPS